MGGRIRTRQEGALGWIVFDQPKRRNAISVEMWQQLPGAVAKLAGDPAVRVVVLRGAGDEAFVAGADISQFGSERTGEQARAGYGRLVGAALGALVNLDKPLLAGIRGPCVGGGVVVALTADLRYAAEDAVFSVPAARLGIGYEPAAVETLVATVGMPAALDILMTARRLDAAEALRLHLVNEVVPSDQLEAFVRERAERMAGNAPLTLRAVKLAARALRRPPEAREGESVEAAYRACFESADYREGVAAFLEKRRPRFRGR